MNVQVPQGTLSMFTTLRAPNAVSRLQVSLRGIRGAIAKLSTARDVIKLEIFWVDWA